MKKNFYFLLMAALVCGLSLTVTSCKDSDDDNNKSEEQQDQQNEQAQDLANARFAVIDQLADVDTIEADFLAQTFEPSIGIASDEGVRIVNTNTMEAAAERFANIVDASIDENTPTYTWTDEKLGTMTYTKVTDGTAWATVDVNIKQVPQLQKIIFRSPDQGDENGAFKGRAFYRFGDVVRVPVKGVDGSKFWQYWVCVRPAFGPEKKEDSHWVTLRVDQKDKVMKYEKGQSTWYIPTGLGTNKEHMQNLAEMLYAMLYPEQWEQNIYANVKNKKMKMFHDFDKNKEHLHNRFFWQNVCKGWDQQYIIDSDGNASDVWHLVFNSNKNSMKRLVNDPNLGLNLLYNGFSWVKEKNLNIKFYQATYTNGTGVNSNMHVANYTEPKGILKDIVFDCRQMGFFHEYNYKQFFNSDGKVRWCVMHATGNELQRMAAGWATKYLGPKDSMKGVTHVYRYYKNIDPEGGSDLSKNPEPDMPL